MEISDIKVLIATPCAGGLCTSEYTRSMMTLSKTDLIFDIMFVNEGDVSQARNNCVTQFLRNDSYTHLLLIDSDIGFDPEQVAALLRRQTPVVAGICPKLSRNWDKASAAEAGSSVELRQATLEYMVAVKQEGESFGHENLDGIVDEWGYMKVAYTGASFMLIERDALARLQEAFPECRYSIEGSTSMDEDCWSFFDSTIHPETRRHLSSELAFCHRWRSVGGEVHVNAQSKLTRAGRSLFVGDTSVIRSEPICV